jgi:ParB-like chromosome segregation protein Spo0J
MPKPAVEILPVDSLRPDPRNARAHSPEQIEQIAASIRQFGFTAPILALPNRTIVAGHGRLEGAKAAGLDKVPVLTVGDGWTDEQRRLYALADNQIALNASWDEKLLAEELQQLTADGVDLALTGFDPAFLDGLLAEPDEVVPPMEFKEFSEEIETEHKCPKCGYAWSGKAS